MARIRSIKPEFWADEKLSALPEATHMLAGALLNYADDEGYFNANPKLIAAACSPLREPSVSIPESLQNLTSAKYVEVFLGCDGAKYGVVINFQKHQRVSHPTPSRIKTLRVSGISPEDSVKTPQALRPDLGIDLGIDLGTNTCSAKDAERTSVEPPQGDEGTTKKPKKIYSASFERWYALYPRKVAKHDASLAFDKALRRIAIDNAISRDIALDHLCAATVAFAKSPKAKGPYVPYPASWLNQGRYEDDRQEWQNDGSDRSEPEEVHMALPTWEEAENWRG